MRLAPVILLALVIAACSDSASPSATPSAFPATVPPGSATVAGRIMFDGIAPEPETIRLDADPKCAAMVEGGRRPEESIVLGADDTLQNVFVYVKDGLPGRIYPVQREPVVLDQQQCRYVPRVLGVQVGQQLTVRNSDALLHNVRAEGAINEPFDVGTPLQGMEITRTFVTREVMVPVKCNVHAWMNAYIGVLEHPFFDVTDQTGTFSIANLPAGTYTIEAWHEKFGTQTQQVTVAESGKADLTFTYKAS